MSLSLWPIVFLRSLDLMKQVGVCLIIKWRLGALRCRNTQNPLFTLKYEPFPFSCRGKLEVLGLSGSQINTLSDCSNTSAWATPQKCSHPKPVPASSSRKRRSSRIHSLSVVYFCSMITALILLKDFSVTSAQAILPNLKQLQLSATEYFWVWIDSGRPDFSEYRWLAYRWFKAPCLRSELGQKRVWKMDGWMDDSKHHYCSFVFPNVLTFLALSCSLQNLHVVDWQMAARLLQAELYIPEALKRVQGLRKQLFVSGGILGWLGSWGVSRILNSNGYSQRQTCVAI